ncbi:Sec1-like protein [Nadsonia fulvescens var. elongata DSM 6958]|uniref:Sec1-like protein n=1 Tax=Nadsonia fulvescens var. elongata DSM 6958 TaxID=857566 RepID=A0A1E3PR26_9ASCO|nr:Sec1-like protein [Nadsonia fulvescens var. elongata DSM 6958]
MANQQPEISVLLAPEESRSFVEVFEDKGVFGDINIYKWKLHFLPLDNIASKTKSSDGIRNESNKENTGSSCPVLSLSLPYIALNAHAGSMTTANEQNFSTKSLLAAQTPYLVALALHDLQSKWGLAGRVTGKGNGAKLVCDLLARLRLERDVALAGSIDDPTLINDTGNKNSRQSKDRTFNGNGSSGKTTDSGAGLNESATVEDLASARFEWTYRDTLIGQHIDQVVIIDRECDMVTPLLTQLVYLGIIDEFYDVNEWGQVEVPSSIVQGGHTRTSSQAEGTADNSNGNTFAESQKSTPRLGSLINETYKKATLSTENDKLFEVLKDVNFSKVGSILNKVARQLQTDYDSRHKATTVSQIKEFVGKLGNLQNVHQNLRFHTALSEEIMSIIRKDEFNQWLEVQQNLVANTLDSVSILNTIEELINRESDIIMILRLLCIQCLVEGGMKNKDLNKFKQDILQTYGYEYLVTFQNLETEGLLFVKSASSSNFLSSAFSSQLPLGSSSSSNGGETMGSKANVSTPFTMTSAKARFSANFPTAYGSLRKPLSLISDQFGEELEDNLANLTISEELQNNDELRQSEKVEIQLEEFLKRQEQLLLSNNKDITGAYSGYAPLSVRLVQCVVDKPGISTSAAPGGYHKSQYSTDGPEGWTGFEDILKGVKGETFDQLLYSNSKESRLRKVMTRAANNTSTLVVFLGGITYGEISCLRLIAEKIKQRDGRSLVIATTSIINGRDIIKASM